MDNGKPFDNKLMNKICDLFGFKQRNSSMYYADANGLVEAFNKTLCNLLKKVVSKSKRDRHERMEEALWAYRTTYHTPTKRVRLRSFQVGDQVLGVKRPIITSRRSGGKFYAKWDGPYVVQEVYSSGAYKIVDSEGLQIGLINGKFIKRYYP
ncbi:uncharacterized protein LOC142172108 [Nicotiana tabacum]|uniref:Uncharacterized protein LOC142172108 n=1 Tax=Nicotiana tabacum TaxID=4097 RepID=A0AC58T420_TOBAC